MSISRSGSVQRTPTLHGESDGDFFFKRQLSRMLQRKCHWELHSPNEDAYSSFV